VAQLLRFPFCTRRGCWPGGTQACQKFDCSLGCLAEGPAGHGRPGPPAWLSPRSNLDRPGGPWRGRRFAPADGAGLRPIVAVASTSPAAQAVW